MGERMGPGVRALDAERHEQVGVALRTQPGAGAQVNSAGIPEALIEAPEELEQRVSPLELFFDLVFVFAITQVSGYVSARPSGTRLVEGPAILAVLWFAWSGYAWLIGCYAAVARARVDRVLRTRTGCCAPSYGDSD